ncbi:MAG: peptidase S10 [Candidatus Aminicenantes bacterium]|nr:peptidase S10 [Candidatus Aminicenantes bacterium]
MCITIIVFCFVFTSFLFPQTRGSQDLREKEPFDQDFSVTKHSIQINGENINYTATVGKLPLKNNKEKAIGHIFFVSYTRDSVEELSQRPVTFAFNGGPGSSSVWLHMGALGPKKVLMDEEGLNPAFPFELIDNPYSLLDITDLVFIDPVSTGFSRAAFKEDPKQFHGYENDIESVGEFIRLYITRFDRWSSPKFILGESYGTIRASGLAGFLQGRTLGMYLNGVILVSAVLNSLAKDFSTGNDLPYIFFFPGYTAAAWYHKQLSEELLEKNLEDVLDESEQFALEEYAPALLKGNQITEAQKSEVIQKVSVYTGLSPDYVEQSNLRVNLYRFLKELLRKDHQTIGRLDSRFKGKDEDAAGEYFEYDPSSAAITGAFSTLFNHYVRTELDYPSPSIYNISGRVRPWGYGNENARTRFSNSAEILRQEMSHNSSLQVFIANGYYDFATPYFATEFAVSHLGLNSEFKDRIFMKYYKAGHMMYIRKASHQKLKQDLKEFYLQAAPDK